MRRFLVLTAVLMSLSSVASAYYHWTFFAQRSGPFQAMRLRFDLGALQDSTVSFFIAQQGPAKLVDGDNFPALVSQIRRAGETWNTPGSALKVKFGGLEAKPFTDVLAEQVTPGIDVVFDDDLPPGVLAYTLPYSYTDLAYLGVANGQGFAPIVRSRLQLASDLTARNQASYSDAFFLTIVHEFGHTLGLQHSMTSSAMSTSVTRATSKASPLTADDIAGLGVLYPTAQFKASTGRIAGKVSVASSGANLASVVALSADGTAVGSMSLPDGTYTIEGLPPGDYLVYTHPLPSAVVGEADPAGISPPQDLQHTRFLASPEFQTRFYPNAKDWKEATRVRVDAGQTASAIDFDLQLLTGNGIYNLQMYGLLGPKQETVVHAPPLPPGFSNWLAFSATGAQVEGGTAIVPGLQLSAISEIAALNQQSLRDYPGQDQYLLIGATVGTVVRATPVAVAVTAGDNLYVLPAAFSVVPSQHPMLTSVASSQDGQGQWVAAITGANLDATTRVAFDGADALSVVTHADGSLTAVAPPAAGLQRAAVEVFNANGQTSWQLQGTAPPLLFAYDAPVDPSAYTTPGSVLAGTNMMLEINGTGTNFLSGKTAVGFGTSDISVRQMWVLSPNKLLVNISVHPKAKLGNVAMTISTGVQLAAVGATLQIRPSDPNQSTLLVPIVNDATGITGTPAGGTLAVRASVLPADTRGWLVNINGVRSPITRTEDGRLLVPVASTIAPGPQMLQLVTTSGLTVPPVVVQIDSQPPSIAVTASQGLAASVQTKLHAGDRVSLTVSNLLITNGGDGFTPTKDDVVIRVAGVVQRAEVIEALPGNSGYRVEFLVSGDAPVGDAQPVTIAVGTRVSAPVAIAIAAVTP